jgi:hypothetical protein
MQVEVKELCTDVKVTVPPVAKTEPEITPKISGVTVPPGETKLADTGVVGSPQKRSRDEGNGATTAKLFEFHA